ncbi:MAG TPA: hypothetical protein VJ484_04520 [Lysobacter sp.]|nr:hypothetical protein [Lysobacter sp.]
MNTLRNLAALALLAFAAYSPAHAEQVAEDTDKPVVADGGSLEGSNWKDVRKLLEDRPELAALASDDNKKAIADALKEQLSKHALKDGQDLEALASEGNKEAVADALNEYLSEHPLKEGQDISDLARNGKEKAIAEALKARLGKRP